MMDKPKETKRLPVHHFTWEYLIDHCTGVIEKTPKGSVPRIIMPTNESIGTKKNKVRFIKEDRLSPVGVIVREDAYSKTIYDTAPAVFNAYEFCAWAMMMKMQAEESEKQIESEGVASVAEPAAS